MNLKAATTKLSVNLSAGMLLTMTALPLIISISIASGATVSAGIVSTLAGGIMLSLTARPNHLVYGPSALLITITYAAFLKLGSYHFVMMAIILSGIIQYLLGLSYAASVLVVVLPKGIMKGIITGTGILSIYKLAQQLIQNNRTGNFINYYFFLILFSLVLLIVLFRYFGILRSHLLILALAFSGIAFVLFILIGKYDPSVSPNWILTNIANNTASFNIVSIFDIEFKKPDYSGILMTGMTLGIISTINSILVTKAVRECTPEKKIDYDNQAKHLGIANIISGLFGGLPVAVNLTSSMANYYFGAKSHISSLMFTILISLTLAIPSILSFISVHVSSILLIFVAVRMIDFPFLLIGFFSLKNRYMIIFYVAVIVLLIEGFIQAICIAWAFDMFLFYTKNAGYRDTYEPRQFLLREEFPEGKLNIYLVFSSFWEKMKWLPEVFGIVLFSISITYIIFKSKLLPYEGHWGTFGGIFALVLLVVDSIRRNRKNDDKNNQS